MQKFFFSIIVFFLSFYKINAQIVDSTKKANATHKQSDMVVVKKDTNNLPSKKEPKQKPQWNYRIGIDGTASSGNVDRQLLNFRTTVSYEPHQSIFGFYTSPKFQYGTNSGVLQERELFVDINSNLFHARHNVYLLIFGEFEQSNIRKILTRYIAGVGVGWKIVGGKNPDAPFKFIISNAIIKESTDFEIKRDKNVLRNSTRLKTIYHIIPEKLSFQSVVFLQPSLIDNNFRWNSSTQFSYKVGKHISIVASYENSYENFNAEGVQSVQSNTTIGLTYSGSN